MLDKRVNEILSLFSHDRDNKEALRDILNLYFLSVIKVQTVVWRLQNITKNVFLKIQITN